MTRQVKWLTLATGYGNVWHGPAYWRLNMLSLSSRSLTLIWISALWAGDLHRETSVLSTVSKAR